MIQNNEVHCKIVNGLIANLNHLMKQGYDSDFVASAAVAAAAAFSTFNLSEGYLLPLDRVGIKRVADTLASRMADSWSTKGVFGGKGGEPV